MSKSALVLGAGGFIGGYMVERLLSEDYYVLGVDQKHHHHRGFEHGRFYQGDLRDPAFMRTLDLAGFDEIYQFAADMGGAGHVFTGENDAAIMHNSATINLNLAWQLSRTSHRPRVFYSSSACIYPERNQMDPRNPCCVEESAYPAAPDSEYGWEKLFSERMYKAFAKNYKLDVRIARYHNIFGPWGTWRGGREKAPAALCRKVAEAKDGDVIEIWGDGGQTRSFLYIDECIEATRRLMRSEFIDPINIGSEEMVSIDELAHMVIEISRKKLGIKHVAGPTGVRGRNSDNRLLYGVLDWQPTQPLHVGLERTYSWIEAQIRGA